MTRALRATRRHSLLIPSRTRVAGVLQCFAFEGRDLICQNTCQSESGGELAQASGCEEGVGGTAPGYWPHRKACLKRREVDSGRWCPLEACAYLEGVPSSGRRKDVGTNAPMVSSCPGELRFLRTFTCPTGGQPTRCPCFLSSETPAGFAPAVPPSHSLTTHSNPTHPSPPVPLKAFPSTREVGEEYSLAALPYHLLALLYTDPSSTNLAQQDLRSFGEPRA